MSALRSLLLGVPGLYEPAIVNLTLDRNLLAFPDPRPGSSAFQHRTVRTSMDLKVLDPSTSTTQEVTGSLLFFLVRGNAAVLPPAGLAEPDASDSTRWWIDRVEDETLDPQGAPRSRTTPSRRVTFGSILETYRSRLP